MRWTMPRNPSVRAKAAAEIMRQWDGRMIENSAAPTIAVQARQELIRLLLEPKLGSAPKDPQPAETALSWKSYQWMMSTVWLENVIQQQPTRWLPAAYANYDELLTAAVEAAVDSNPAHGSDAPQELNSWKWGDFHPVEIQHPIFGKIPFSTALDGTWIAEAIRQRVHRKSGIAQPRTVRTNDGGSCRP